MPSPMHPHKEGFLTSSNCFTLFLSFGENDTRAVVHHLGVSIQTIQAARAGSMTACNCTKWLDSSVGVIRGVWTLLCGPVSHASIKVHAAVIYWCQEGLVDLTCCLWFDPNKEGRWADRPVGVPLLSVCLRRPQWGCLLTPNPFALENLWSSFLFRAILLSTLGSARHF